MSRFRPCSSNIRSAERTIEHEFVPFGTRHGAGIMVWSPLASGLLSGKYRPTQAGNAGRLDGFRNTTHPGFQKFNERNWTIVAELEKVAAELGRSMAQVALNWVATQPGVASVILGATRLGSVAGQSRGAGLLDSRRPSASGWIRSASAAAPFPYSYFGSEIQGRRHRRRRDRRQAFRLCAAGACRGRGRQRHQQLIGRRPSQPEICGRAPRDIAAPFVYRNSHRACFGAAPARGCHPERVTRTMTRTR